MKKRSNSQKPLQGRVRLSIKSRFLTLRERKEIVKTITEIQGVLYKDRKRMSTQSDNEWNAKAHMVFAHEHLNMVKRNLMRYSDYRNRSLKEEVVLKDHYKEK